MKYNTFLGAILLLALLLAACAPVATEAPANTSVPTLEPTEPLATDTAAVTETPAATAASTPTVEAPTEGIPVTGGTTLKATISDNYGPILVDGDGVALYLFMNDTQNSEASACTDAECAEAWPAFISEGDVQAGPGTVQNLIGTITRADGTQQVTYNGWPLYYSASDHGAGSTSGQAVDGLWFLVSPSGKAIPE